ncbi:recombinase family protein [Vibrio cyclitrophicus]
MEKEGLVLRTMLQFIQSENQHKKVIDAVVVYNLSRLTRRVEEQVRLIGIFKRFDVELKSIADNLIDWDSTTTLLFNILGSVNEHQSALNGKTVTDRLYDTARKGFFTGGTVPFGYKSINAGKTNDKQRKKLVVDDSEAEYVKQIFHWAKGDISNQPMGVKKIANKLNELKITNRMKLWNKNAIGKLLNNPIYIGQYIWKNLKV